MKTNKCRVAPNCNKLAVMFNTTPRMMNAIYSNYIDKASNAITSYPKTDDELNSLAESIKSFREQNKAASAVNEKLYFKQSFGSNAVYSYNELIDKFNVHLLDGLVDEITSLIISKLDKVEHFGLSSEEALKKVGAKQLFSQVIRDYTLKLDADKKEIGRLKTMLDNAKSELEEINKSSDSASEILASNKKRQINSINADIQKILNEARVLMSLVSSDSALIIPLITMSIPTINKVLGVKINDNFDLSAQVGIEYGEEIMNIDDEESSYEHWMMKLDQEDPTGTISNIVKKALMRQPMQRLVINTTYSDKLDKNGNPVYAKDDKGQFILDENGNKIVEQVPNITKGYITEKTPIFKVDRMSNPTIEAKKLLRMLKDCSTEEQMMNVLKNSDRYGHDDVDSEGNITRKSLYTVLNENPMLRTTFKTSFDKYFQEYEAIDTHIDNNQIFAPRVIPLNTGSKKNIVSGYFNRMSYIDKPGTNSIFVVEGKSSTSGSEYNGIRVNFVKYYNFKQWIKETFIPGENQTNSLFDRQENINVKISSLAYVFDCLGMKTSSDALSNILSSPVVYSSFVSAVRTIASDDAEAIFNPANKGRFGTSSKKIDKKIENNAELSDAFSALIRISDPNTTSSSYKTMFNYAGSSLSSYILPSPYTNFIKSIRSLSASTVDANGNEIKSQLQQYLEDKYLRSVQYSKRKTDSFGNQVIDEDNILNRWLSDIYNCDDNSKSSDSVKNRFAVIRGIGIDNVNFEDISDREHMLMFLSLYFNHRSKKRIEYVDSMPTNYDPAVHYYINGKPIGYNNGNIEYRNDYAYIPSFITGDTNALRCIRVLHYGDKEILHGMYNLYLSDLQNKNVRDFFDSNNFAMYANGKEVFTNNFKFGILSFLNSKENKEKLSELYDKYGSTIIPESEFTKIALDHFENGFKQFKLQLESLGLLEKTSVSVTNELDEQSTVERYKYFDSFLGNNEGTKAENLEKILYDFYINYKFGMYNQAQLMQVSPNFFSGVEDYQKRNKGTLTNGMRLSSQAMIGNERLFDENHFSQKVAYFYDITASVSDDIFQTMRRAMINGGYSEADADKIMEAYKKNSLTDGQAYRTFDSYRKILGGLGLQFWSKQQESAYQEIMSIIEPVRNGEKDELSAEEIQRIENLNIGLMPLKPINDSIETFGKNEYKIPVQFKYAEVPIIPEMYPKNSPMRQIGDWMRKSGIDLLCSDKCLKKGCFGQIDFQFVTTIDNGVPKYVAGTDFTYKNGNVTIDIHKGDILPGINAKGKIIADSEYVDMSSQRRFRNKMQKKGVEVFLNYNDSGMDYSIDNIMANQMQFVEGVQAKGNYVIHDIPLDNYLIQLSKPDKVSHDSIYGTQTRKIVGGNIINSDSVFYNVNGVKMSGKNVQVLYNVLNSAKFVNSYRDFLNIIENPSKFTEIISRNILSGDRMNPAIMQRIALNGETPVVPYGELSNSNDIQSSIISIFRKSVVRQTISGGSVVQASSFATGVDYIDNPDLKLIKDKNGNPVSMDVEMPFDFAIKNGNSSIKLDYDKYCNADGTFKTDNDGKYLIDKHYPGIRDIVLYRIPTEGEYSIFVSRIKRCTPKTASNTIKMPVECTTIAGFDFDIDTLNIIRHTYDSESTKLSGMQIWESFYKDNQGIYEALLNEREMASKEYSDELIAKYDIPIKKLDKEGRPPLHYYWDSLRNSSTFGKLLGDKNETITKYINEHLNSISSERKSIPQDVDFKSLIDGTYSSEDIDNMILDLTIAIMTSKDVWANHFVYGGFENASRYAKFMRLVTNDAVTLHEDGKNSYDTSWITDEAIDNLEDVDGGYDYSEPMTSIDFKEKNQIAGTLIGIFANDNINIYLSKYMQTLAISNTKKPVIFGSLAEGATRKDGSVITEADGLGRNMLFDYMNGHDIAKLLHELLSASVDAVKDPTLNYLNLNSITADAAAMLIRLGYSMNDIGMLFNQPIIKEVCRYINRNPSENNITNVLNKLCIEHGFGKLPSTSKGYNVLNVKSGKLLYAMKNNTFDEVQYDVAKLFNMIMSYKSELSNFVQRTRNTSANIVKSQFENFIRNKEKIDDQQFNSLVIKTNDDMEFPIFDYSEQLDNDVDVLSDFMESNRNHPFGYENVLYNLINNAMEKMIDKYTLLGTYYYSRCRESLKSFMAPWGIPVEEMESFHNFIPMARLVNYDGDFNPNEINPDTFINPDGKTNAELYLFGIQGFIEDVLADGVDLSQYQISNILNFVPAKDGSMTDHIRLDMSSHSFRSTQGEKLDITKSWQDMYSKGGNLRRLAIALYMHSFYTRGLNPDSNVLMSYAPVCVMNAVKSSYSSDSSYLDVFDKDSFDGNDDVVSSTKMAFDFMVQNSSNPKVVKRMPFALNDVMGTEGNNSVILSNTTLNSYFDEAKLGVQKDSKGNVSGILMRPLINIDGKLFVLDNFVKSGYNNMFDINTKTAKYVLFESSPMSEFSEYFNKYNGYIFGYSENALTISSSSINSEDLVTNEIDGNSSSEIASDRMDNSPAKVVDENGNETC